MACHLAEELIPNWTESHQKNQNDAGPFMGIPFCVYMYVIYAKIHLNHLFIEHFSQRFHFPFLFRPTKKEKKQNESWICMQDIPVIIYSWHI